MTIYDEVIHGTVDHVSQDPLSEFYGAEVVVRSAPGRVQVAVKDPDESGNATAGPWLELDDVRRLQALLDEAVVRAELGAMVREDDKYFEETELVSDDDELPYDREIDEDGGPVGTAARLDEVWKFFAPWATK